MRIWLAFLLAYGMTTAAFAQQQSTPIEQAMGQKIMAEINNGLACSARLIEVQKQLDDAQAKLKELEPKDKAKPTPPPS